MTTFHSISDSTLAYNAVAHWSRHHNCPYWSVTETEFRFAVINDFGDLIAVPWSAQ